jgi:hypothetical protein
MWWRKRWGYMNKEGWEGGEVGSRTMWAKGKEEWLKEGGEVGKRSRRGVEEEVGMWCSFQATTLPLPWVVTLG